MYPCCYTSFRVHLPLIGCHLWPSVTLYAASLGRAVNKRGTVIVCTGLFSVLVTYSYTHSSCKHTTELGLPPKHADRGSTALVDPLHTREHPLGPPRHRTTYSFASMHGQHGSSHATIPPSPTTYKENVQRVNEHHCSWVNSFQFTLIDHGIATIVVATFFPQHWEREYFQNSWQTLAHTNASTTRRPMPMVYLTSRISPKTT